MSSTTHDGGVVVARCDERPPRAVADRAAREVAADRRAAHPADDEPGARVDRCDPGRLDPPQRVLELVRLVQDVVDHPAGVDATDSRSVERAHPISSPGCTRASSSTTAPAAMRASFPITAPGRTSAPSPIRAPSATMHSRSAAVGPDRDAVVQHRPLDARVGAHAAMVADDRLRPDVRAARQAALVDQRAGLVALRAACCRSRRRAGPTSPRGSGAGVPMSFQ